MYTQKLKMVASALLAQNHIFALPLRAGAGSTSLSAFRPANAFVPTRTLVRLTRRIAIPTRPRKLKAAFHCHTWLV